MTRLTISKHHQIYLDSIASQMGCNSSEALNYLLWELRKSNYQFGQALYQAQQAQHFDPSTYEQATVMSGLSFIPQAIQEYENVQEIDPVIQRLINSGLEMEF